MLRLVVKDSSGERRFETERDEVLLGRRDGADVQLADRACSRNHCVLRIEGDRVRLIDLGTVNGTVVGGRKVAEALLGTGAAFSVGETVVEIAGFRGAGPLALEEAPAPAPPPSSPPPPAPHAPARDDFAREVRAMVARAPWYLISLAVHVVLLLVLDLVAFRVDRQESHTAMVSTPPEELAEPEDFDNTALDEPELEARLDPIEEQLEIDEPLAPAAKKDPHDASEFDSEDVLAQESIGLLRGRKGIIRLENPLPITKFKGADETLNKGDLTGEQGRARDVVERAIGEGIRRARQRLGARHIVVVQGEFDKIEEVLEQYEWPYTLIRRDDLRRRRYPEAKILFINCARKPSNAVEASKLASVVKSYAQRGCWVVTSDWAVEPYLTHQSGIDGFVKEAGKPQRRQLDTTVTVAPVSSDPLLDGVFPRRGPTIWWLEETSTMVFDVSDRVDVLVRSAEMKKRYGAEVVVLKFDYGRGKVIHLLGHFYQKDGNRRGLVGMHRLINNVILARLNASDN